MSRGAKARVSREDWLQAALQLLIEQGVDGVKIDVLARQIDVAKTSFYWYFENRKELLDAMLEYWQREYTSIIAQDPDVAQLPAIERLAAVDKMVEQQQWTRFDPVISDWALKDASVRKMLEKTYEVRMKFIRAAFEELGFKGADLEMRARVFVCYVSHEASTFPKTSMPKTKKMRELRIQLLAQQ